MKIVCISDTHMRHTMEIPDGDVLVHSGDFTIGRDSLVDLMGFAEWFLNLPHKHKVLVPGNHDWCFQNKEAIARSLLPGVHILINEEVVIDDVKFYGTPIQPIFHNWAFNASDEVRRKAFKQIPIDTAVLVTHTPPYGILDVVDRYGAGSVGCEILAEQVSSIQPKAHIFGHIHEAYGQYNENGTQYVNCSLCDLNYRAINPPIIIDI